MNKKPDQNQNKAKSETADENKRPDKKAASLENSANFSTILSNIVSIFIKK